MQHKEIKNHAEQVSNIKPFIDLFNWNYVKYSTVIDNNCVAFERKNPEIALVVLYTLV